jgi:O-antigen/teichoic acid export membrane protein
VSVHPPPARTASSGERGPAELAATRDAVAAQVRGSSILLVGRVLAMAVNLIIQVLTVRYLSKDAFGAFAYALSIVSVAENLVTFGLDRSITRFVPIYEERGDRARLLGTLVLALSTVLLLGLAVCVVVIGLQGWVAGTVISDQQAVALLAILILLAPVNALDSLLMGMFAVFAKPRAIFVRRYVLNPGLRLLVVLVVILRGADVGALAAGYVLGGALGVAVYSGVLARLLRQRGLLSGPLRGNVDIPTREVMAFTIPLLSSELVYSVMNLTDVFLLERYAGTEQVAALRAVQPAARLNQLVFMSFTLLFTPLAARMFARGDRASIDTLYWRTALWLTVLSFPIFAVTTSLAGPVTVTLFGDRYASSAILLTLLSVGYYANVAFGFNGLTLKVYGAVRYVVVLNVAAAVCNVGLNVALIPRYGALGAAIGTAATLVLHNVFKQLGLRKGTGVRLLDRASIGVYLTVAIAVCTLWAVQALVAPPLAVGIALAALASLVVLLVARPHLDLGGIAPELRRVPLIGRWMVR